jgi:hypothetical protein
VVFVRSDRIRGVAVGGCVIVPLIIVVSVAANVIQALLLIPGSLPRTQGAGCAAGHGRPDSPLGRWLALLLAIPVYPLFVFEWPPFSPASS